MNTKHAFLTTGMIGLVYNTLRLQSQHRNYLNIYVNTDKYVHS